MIWILKFQGQGSLPCDLSPRLTDLMKAVKNQDVDLVRALLESGADVEARDSQGQNVLYHAFPQTFSESNHFSVILTSFSYLYFLARAIFLLFENPFNLTFIVRIHLTCQVYFLWYIYVHWSFPSFFISWYFSSFFFFLTLSVISVSLSWRLKLTLLVASPQICYHTFGTGYVNGTMHTVRIHALS